MTKIKDKLAGVIDIGSHSIRLYIGEIVRKGKIRIIENLWVPIAIGKDTFTRGNITNSTISELVKSLKNFKSALKTYNITNIRAVATSALREASNSNILVDRVRNSTGVDIEIIEPIEETAIIYNAIKDNLKKSKDFVDKNVFTLIVGAGTTQMVYQRKGYIIFSETFHIGTLRAEKIYSLHRESYKVFIDGLAHRLNDNLETFRKEEAIDKFVVINDDCLNVINKLSVAKKSRNISAFRMSGKSFLKFYKDIYTMSQQKIKKRYNIDDSVIQTTMIALLFIGKFFELTGSARIVFPEINFASAVLWIDSLKKKKTDKDISSSDKRKNILSAAFALSEKFKVDVHHVQQVRKLAMSIFDQLKDSFGFSKYEHIYLETAAILHDIGKYISFKSHHKHSATLIANSEILGFNRKEMIVISLIARYHRRTLPRETHSNFNRLSEKNRIIISRMAAILRIADAMDKTHFIEVERVKINLTEDACEIYVKFKDDNFEHFDLFKMNVTVKSDFFEKVYGLNVKLEKMTE